MNDLPENLSFASRAVHAGAAPDPTTGARATPIYQTTSYAFRDAEHASALFNLQEFGNIYTRIMNPTQDTLEQRIASLEGGVAALAVASGHGAQLVAFHTLMQPGDHIVAAKNLYGGSINQLGHSFKKMGWSVDFVDADPAAFKAAIKPETRAVFIESIANPGGLVMDIEAIADVAHQAGVPLIVDNTLATPYLCRPIEHGADIVVESLTKFLGGHGNSIGGVIVDSGKFDWASSGNYPDLSEPNSSYNDLVFTDAFGPVAFIIACRTVGLRDLGPCISPMNAFLILQGIETLPLRMQRHTENARIVANYLKHHDEVAWVSHGGDSDHPNNALVQKYTPEGPGAVFTFGLKGGYEAGVALVSNLKLFSHLANVGDTRSLVIHPASTTHSQLSPEARAAAGAGDEVIRLSIGIEDTDDIVADLEQALNSASA